MQAVRLVYGFGADVLCGYRHASGPVTDEYQSTSNIMMALRKALTEES